MDASPPPHAALQTAARAWFENLRDQICARFEAIEAAHSSGPLADRAPGRFERSAWQRPAGEGGPAEGGADEEAGES